MKIALVLASNTCYAPYIYHYIRIMKEEKVDFDIIIRNKYNINEKDCISYNNTINLNKSRISRLYSYYGYVKFVKQVLNKNKYDKVIVFTLFLGILLGPYLSQKYKGKYFFDIRDYSPALKLLSKMAKFTIKNSFATAISSPGFLHWLPTSNKYIISHNYSFQSNNIVDREKTKPLDKHVILTIGLLRDFKTNNDVLQSFGNNKNFILKFVGNGPAYEPLKKIAVENNISNVLFTGRYDKVDEINYLKNASLINILLGDDLNSKTLMTNRIYLAINNRIPVMVNNDSMQAKYVSKFNLGILIKTGDLLPEKVTNYFQNFDADKFQINCKEFLLHIEADQKIFESKLKDFLQV